MLPGNGKSSKTNGAQAVTSPGAGCLIQASDTILQSKLTLSLTLTGKAK